MTSWAVTPRGVAALSAILGREPYDMRLEVPLETLSGKRILITGAAGSIGSQLLGFLHDFEVMPTDIDTLDVTDGGAVLSAFDEFRPEIVFHLAGAKHAPEGEEDPWNAMQVNAFGTRNILACADATGGPECVRVVVASTCKACNPETAYGASKLLAERMTLNAGHSVARFYNVVETQGNVFDIWDEIRREDPIPYTDCWRFFISLHEAVCLSLWSAVLGPGRYSVYPGYQPRWMVAVARALYPGRELVKIDRRRGDRNIEPICGAHEYMIPVEEHEALRLVVSPHD